ncbi:DNA polymerase III subunit gamma/tau [Alicyclobacillus ferrooxydans]|uniref:DNA-directed DNA polymerase n=1 Tax=Alicyclobacillus ferrooxydans TaxID=471514 RepID=A0A0P9CFQ7_9BACL|nr:DNA polymerase III subunit gamma/tau [Alicyclobacillus ferrooxydans]KPV44627.1 DNA polymerase III subunit gamma/tau [Alicyclobacillus ferrooxydans]
MSYQALYRAWRPQTFSDLIGQPHVRQTLMNAILDGRVAHAYLFCGPRGTGKTSAAKVLAKAVNCQNPQGVEPCNQCEACVSITTGSNVDVEEIDAASNRGVDEIRQLRDKVQYAPASVMKKVYIVDEVHMLTTEAFNALLKTLEEPPSHTLFVLATTEPHKIPATIISRCQRFDFRRIEPELIIERLREICETKDWTADEESLWRIAEAADGGLRDALGLLEQTAAYARGEITAEAAAHVMGGVQTEELLALVRDIVESRLKPVIDRLIRWYSSGKDATRILYEVLQLLRDLFIVKLSGEVPPRFSKNYPQVAELCSDDWLLDAMQRLGEVYVQLRYVDQPRIALETALLGLVPRTRKSHQPEVNYQPEVSHQPQAAGSVPSHSAGTHPSTGMQPVATVSQPVPTLEAVPQKAVQPQPTSQPATQISSPATDPKDASGQRAKPRQPSARTTAARKTEVLRQLYAASDATFLEQVTNSWEEILTLVKAERITTHAWLINGDPVLATGDTIVLAFSSRIHRDAVMKQDERNLIQQVQSRVFGRDVQVLALLKADWQAFVDTLTEQSESHDDNSNPTNDGDDLVHRAVGLFGRALVEVEDKE